MHEKCRELVHTNCESRNLLKRLVKCGHTKAASRNIGDDRGTPERDGETGPCFFQMDGSFTGARQCQEEPDPMV